jgi:multiple sugar transport system substrate-binding protein
MEDAGLTRRRLLAVTGAAGLAAALGVATTGSPFGGGRTTIDFWHLFGGGDGARLTQMLDALAKAEPDLDVRSLILPWGNPYYTKLSLAAIGGRPPDVAVMHATRLAAFGPASLLEPLPAEALRRHGLTADRFLPKPWQAGQVGGTQYAIPLDAHPFDYVNSDLAGKAGLLAGDAVLRRLDGEGALLDAFDAIKSRTGMLAWNAFLWPFVITSAGDLFTVPVGLATVNASYGAPYAQVMALAVLGALPLLVVFLLFQRQIVQGIANQGLKG